MAARVARRARRRKAAAVAAVRRRAVQRQVRAELRAEVAAAVQATVERALQREVCALVGRDRYARRATAAWATVPARCSACGANWSTRFWRAGSYRRTLLTVAAAVELRVPRVGCICGGTVPLEFAAVGRYERGWGDLQERARELAGLCLSLADAREILAADSGQPVAASTLCGWVGQAGGLAEALRAGPLAAVPAVVLLDGIWVKLLEPTGTWFTDRAGRQRQRQKRVRAVVLVAYGVNPATGERWVLDWERAAAEDEPSWRRLLERLLGRGLRADAGLDLVVHDGGGGLEAALDQVYFGRGVLRQRCVFHVLRNLRDAVRSDGRSREARRERQRAVLRDAAAIWQTTDRTEVYRRQEAFRQRWAEAEPAAVAALGRAFPATLGYLAALERGRERDEVWDVRHLRTTSALERLNRALRQKARQVGAFKAAAGLTAALGLVLAHRHVSGPKPPADLWTEVLEAGLLAADAR